MREVWSRLIDPVFPDAPEGSPTFDWATVGWISLWTVFLVLAHEQEWAHLPRVAWAALGWLGALIAISRGHGARIVSGRLVALLGFLLLAQYLAYDMGWRPLYSWARHGDYIEAHWLNAWMLRVSWRGMSLLAVPALGAALLGFSLAEIGARPKGKPAFNLWPILGGLYALAVPTLFWAAGQASFHRTYPRVQNFPPRNATVSMLEGVQFEGFYALGFCATEGFWRGLVLFPLVRWLGPHAVPFAAVGYTIAHFNKPPLEVLIALPGGFVTGWIALKHRSFWPFIVLHVAVALTMEAFTLLRA